MPRAIESLSKRPGRPAEYDWDAILGTGPDNPQDTVFVYERGEDKDFTAKDQSFMNRVREVAKERGLNVHLRNPEDGQVEVEVFVPTDEQATDGDADTSEQPEA